MKKLTYTLMLCVLLATTAQAGPFLVCDPQDGVLLYDVYANGEIIVADHPAETDGSLRYEFTDPMPDTVFTAVAKNVWGPSEESDPYTSPSLAAKPQNLRLMP